MSGCSISAGASSSNVPPILVAAQPVHENKEHPPRQSASRTNSATTKINSRKARRHALHVATNSNRSKNSQPPTDLLNNLGICAALYLVGILAWASWEFFVTPNGVQRLHHLNLAEQTAITRHQYYQQKLASESSPTLTLTDQEDATKFWFDGDDELQSISSPSIYRDQHTSDPAAPIPQEDDDNRKDAFVGATALTDEYIGYTSGTDYDHEPNFNIITEEANRIVVEQGALSNGVKFLYCGNLGQQQSRIKTPVHSRDVVLLAARIYFKEMPMVQSSMDNADDGTKLTFMHLCREAKLLESNVVDSFTALDLNGSVQPDHLIFALQGLVKLKLVKVLPLAAIITPGTKSSQTMMDWMTQGGPIHHYNLVSQVARNWICASARVSEALIEYESYIEVKEDTKGSFYRLHDDKRVILDDGTVAYRQDDKDRYNDDEIDKSATQTAKFNTRIRNLGLPKYHPLRNLAVDFGWRILAIYGEYDAEGKRNALWLNERGRAVVTELSGTGERCFVDSPVQFAEAIVMYLDQELLFAARTFDDDGDDEYFVTSDP